MWVSRNPPPPKKKNTQPESEDEKSGEPVADCGRLPSFLCWQARALAVDDIITTVRCCLANGLEDIFGFPIKMKCMRQLGGWKSIRCCLPCSNVYCILINIIHFCNSSFVYDGVWQLLLIRQLPMATLRWPETQTPPVYDRKSLTNKRESRESFNFTEASSGIPSPSNRPCFQPESQPQCLDSEK